jgi:hypothetical protein
MNFLIEYADKYVVGKWNRIFLFYFIVTVLVTLQKFLLGPDSYNNYPLYKFSFLHLLEGNSLYALYPDQYWDNYKYGPIFAILIAPCYFLPDWLGIQLWTFMNMCAFLCAIYFLPITDRQKTFVYMFGFFEYLTALQNVQISPITTAITVGAFVFLEKKKPFWAASLVIFGFFVKLYPIVAAATFLLYPYRLKFVGSCLVWALVFFVLPMLFTTPELLLYQYHEWYLALVDKTTYHHDISLMGIIDKNIYSGIPDAILVGIGVLLFCTAYLRFAAYNVLQFRLLFLCSTLLWMVIFNPGSESPTFLIAVTGAAIWYAITPKTKLSTAVILFVFVLTCMSPSDIIPKPLRIEIDRYALKALPCVVAWVAVMYHLYMGTKKAVP